MAGRPTKRRLLVQVRVVGGHAEPGDHDRLVGELRGPLRRADDHRRGAVGLRAAVEQVERVAHRRRGEHLLDRHLVAEVGVGVELAVVVVLHGDGGEVLAGGAELVHVPGGERGEQHRRRLAAGEDRVARRGSGQQTLLGRLVPHLLDADDEHDVVHARGHGHAGDPEGVAARSGRRSRCGCTRCRPGRWRSARCCRRCPPGPRACRAGWRGTRRR